MEKSNGSSFHALVLPFPYHSHITALLRFSQRLLHACKDVKLTFVNTQHNHLRLISHSPPLSITNNPNIHFLSIPFHLPFPYSSPDASLHPIHITIHAFMQQQALLEDIISHSISTPSPITCIISDFFFHWTQDLANHMHIKRVIFWTSNASYLYGDQLVVTGALELSDSGERSDEDFETQHIDDDHTDELHNQIISHFMASKMHPKLMQIMKEVRYKKVEQAACFVVGSLQMLEAAVLNGSMPLKVPMRCVTPFLSLNEEESNSEGDEGGLKCLSWLNTQAQASSVLYISFGSVVKLPLEQLEELALGIEGSRVPFLWVVRSDNRSDTQTEELLEAFAERTKDRGRITAWAPQLSVLKHPAIGGFLTHCGWNSTLESIAMGVPMLCWPISAEQPLNSALIQRVWKVGMGFAKGEKGFTEKEEVKRVILAFLNGEEGKALKQKAVELGEDVRKALDEEGELEAFLGDVMFSEIEIQAPVIK